MPLYLPWGLHVSQKRADTGFKLLRYAWKATSYPLRDMGVNVLGSSLCVYRVATTVQRRSGTWQSLTGDKLSQG